MCTAKTTKDTIANKHGLNIIILYYYNKLHMHKQVHVRYSFVLKRSSTSHVDTQKKLTCCERVVVVEPHHLHPAQIHEVVAEDGPRRRPAVATIVQLSCLGLPHVGLAELRVAIEQDLDPLVGVHEMLLVILLLRAQSRGGDFTHRPSGGRGAEEPAGAAMASSRHERAGRRCSAAAHHHCHAAVNHHR